MTDTIDRPGQVRLPAAVRREQLLRVALESFAAHGYHGTAMNDVAEAAGVTKPVLYQHFESKKALYTELVNEIGADLERRILVAASDAKGPRDQVERGFREFFRWATQQGDAFRVLFADRNRTDVELSGAVTKVESMIADTVASLIRVEGLSVTERDILAHGVVGLAEATSRRWLIEGLGSGNDADAFAETVAELAWSGLRGIHR